MSKFLTKFFYIFCFIAFIYAQNCAPNASVTVVESIPIGIPFDVLSIYWGWKTIINRAQKSLDFAQFYFTLTEGEKYPERYGGWMGRDIYNDIIKAHKRGVKIRVVINEPNSEFPDTDAFTLAKAGVIELRTINWPELLKGGILHTKLIISDSEHVFQGSANLDWRALAQIKEMGVVFQDCAEVALDVEKEFDMYWTAANLTKLPSVWPTKYSTIYNAANPLKVKLNGIPTSLFLATSPNEFTAKGRVADLDAILYAIGNATSFIGLEVMDFAESSLYEKHNYYWPIISDALTAAAFNKGVNVKLLFGKWNHTLVETEQWIYSLSKITNIEVRWFITPPMVPGPQVPYTRVNHAKYMVTDERAYCTTSNLSADYFTDTGGVSYSFLTGNVKDDMTARFDRDWDSQYAVPV